MESRLFWNRIFRELVNAGTCLLEQAEQVANALLKQFSHPIDESRVLAHFLFHYARLSSTRAGPRDLESKTKVIRSFRYILPVKRHALSFGLTVDNWLIAFIDAASLRYQQPIDLVNEVNE